jgi:hypothetical protein
MEVGVSFNPESKRQDGDFLIMRHYVAEAPSIHGYI